MSGRVEIEIEIENKRLKMDGWMDGWIGRSTDPQTASQPDRQTDSDRQT